MGSNEQTALWLTQRDAQVVAGAITKVVRCSHIHDLEHGDGFFASLRPASAFCMQFFRESKEDAQCVVVTGKLQECPLLRDNLDPEQLLANLTVLAGTFADSMPAPSAKRKIANLLNFNEEKFVAKVKSTFK